MIFFHDYDVKVICKEKDISLCYTTGKYKIEQFVKS